MKADDLEQLIASRRSNILIDATRDVDDTIVDRIVESAQWAPNHKKTWPLRIAIVSGNSRARLGETIADVMEARTEDPTKVAKARTKYLRAPRVIVVASAQGSTENETEENRYSVAASIQNMLLMCESLGLAALWGSPAKGANDAITGFCGFDASDHVMGIIYIGWASRTAAPVPRPSARVNRLD